MKALNVTLPMAEARTHGTASEASAPRAGWLLAAIAIALLLYGLTTRQGHGGHDGAHAHVHAPTIFAIIPFAALLLCVAVLPLIHSCAHWWEHNMNKLLVGGVLSLLVLGYYIASEGPAKALTVLEHAVLLEYIPFITFLFALYVISGGISLTGDLAAHPKTNTAFLAVGSLLASLIGTTGASMLLIRPLLQTNAERRHKAHTVVFFIFLVSNIGGSLLPIGDPPLFLGFLKGIPFFWTLNLWPMWLASTIALLVIYFIWDTFAYRKEATRDIARDERERTPLRLGGKFNFLLLLGVVLCTATIEPGKPVPLLGFEAFRYLREVLLIVLAILSLKWTPAPVRAANQFNYTAILEVAALFIGIFICMQVPIEILRASGDKLSGVLNSPASFFWATGTLSSFLDNAPTYVIFLESAVKMTPAGVETVTMAGGQVVSSSLLLAVSIGAVFMGANTYIGNGPNFMVKSIAEQRGVAMPSFFGYMLYSVGILIPLFVVITFVFLR